MDRELSDRNVIAECYFLDVGQGTSNIILLGERKGIVIDCGASGRVPLLLLRRYVDHIVALIVSHNDRDHQGGASAIIAAYPNAIDRVYFLQDRPVESIALFSLVERALADGHLTSEPIRLERDDNPREIFSDPEKSLSLELIFPNFRANLNAQRNKRPNETSAVMVLFCGSRKIIYPGDATIDDWQRIRELFSPISADIVSVPHHGGNIGEIRQKGETEEQFTDRKSQNLEWLYSECVRCNYAVVSVGTNNQHGHPKAASISALRNASADVMCTQITNLCHDHLERLRPGVRRAEFPSQSRQDTDLTKKNSKSRNVACAGTIIAQIGLDTVEIIGFSEHQAGVNSLKNSTGGHPLCRK
jgi:competence protein ComEC